MDIVLFGMQGSGKGTQAKLLSELRSFVIFEAGHELRRLAKEESELGEKIRNIMALGKLVPSDVVMEIISNFIKNIGPETAVLFDGIPRSKDQKDRFDELMRSMNRDFKAILIELSEDEAMTRLLTRKVCEKCGTSVMGNYEGTTCGNCGGTLIVRGDDNPEAIRTRLRVFTDETLPVIEEYEMNGILMKVNGKQEVPQVNEDILKVLDSCK